MVNVSIWPCSSCSLPSRTRGGTVLEQVAQRAFAFAQVVVVSESVFHVFKGAQRGSGVARGRSFLLGGADVLRGLEFSAEEDRLGDPGGEAPGDGIKRTNTDKLGGP